MNEDRWYGDEESDEEGNNDRNGSRRSYRSTSIRSELDVLETMLNKINMLKEYFDREWTTDDECVRSSKCAIIDALTRQVSNLD